LSLDGGRAMRLVIRALAQLNYAWAYRVVDARAFGLPQRRRRVVILASRNDDPRTPLLGQCRDDRSIDEGDATAFGFYWTEGNKGIGWAPNSIPALKSGSGVSIPSAPAVWIPSDRFFCTPDIRDAERLQGFPSNWTNTLTPNGYLGRSRWRLVGNAVPVPIAEWIAKRLSACTAPEQDAIRVPWNSPWGTAGWGHNGHRYSVNCNEWPVQRATVSIIDFFHYPPKPLSARATAGFANRLEQSNLNVRPRFLRDLRAHAKSVAAR